MSKAPDAFTRLINALKILPNVGPKSAQRMAHQLLQSKREQAQELVDALQYALKQVQHCRMCNTFCEGSVCDICSDESRDKHRLMIVHMPADVSNMETANCHDGLYFVLMGQISPAQAPSHWTNWWQGCRTLMSKKSSLQQTLLPKEMRRRMCWQNCLKTFHTKSAVLPEASLWGESWNMSMLGLWRRPFMKGAQSRNKQ